MAYEDTQSIINDALFRAGEIPGSSDWDAKAVEYINRSYSAVCNGTSEFLPEHVDDWWWMRDRGVLNLEPVYATGTVSVTNGDIEVEFTNPPSGSVEGWRLKVTGHPDTFVITSHEATSADAELDAAFTGVTDGAAAFQLIKTVYDLGSIAGVISPMVSFRENESIYGISPERMDFLYPLQRLSPGVPRAFSMESDTEVRFSHGGRTDGVSMRVEYRYKILPTPLENSPTSIPLIPRQYRHVLSDMLTMQIMLDKNDDRVAGVSQSARGVLKAMHAEHRHNSKKMDSRLGQIMPRLGKVRRTGPLRTESGLIIG